MRRDRAVVRRIVPCGGQQLLYPALTGYVLALARRPRPKVLFLGTASGDSAEYLLTFYRAFAGVDCEPSHLALFDRVVDDIDALVRLQDVVIVGGGNTANMLAVWRLHGVEHALRSAYAGGTVLSGWSAGCLCWFEGGITDSFTPRLGALRDGLGILAGSACPHYDSEESRRPVYAREIAAGLSPGIALEDGVAARYDDERLVEVVSARVDGRAFQVDANGERPLAVRMLT
jgi:dipeptidase E